MIQVLWVIGHVWLIPELIPDWLSMQIKLVNVPRLCPNCNKTVSYSKTKEKAISSLACHRLPMLLNKTAIVSCCSMLLINIFRSTSSNMLRKCFCQVLSDLLYVVVIQSLSCAWPFVTPWMAARQDSLSFTNSQSLLKLMAIESVMPPSHLILCHPLLLLPSIFPRIRVFSNESVLRIRWPKCWSFSISISPSNEVQLYNFLCL